MSDEAQAALYAAIIDVMGAVSGVQKTGENTQQRYTYASDADLLRVLKPAMTKAGLGLIPTTIERCDVEHATKHSKGIRCDVIVAYTLVHKGGGTLQVQAIGSGFDSLDKAPYKALTGALKYALRQTFLVPTGDDPEIELSEEDRKEAADKARKAKHHPSFADDQGRFFATLGELGIDYEELASWLETTGRPRPSGMTQDERNKLVAHLLAKRQKENGNGE